MKLRSILTSLAFALPLLLLALFHIVLPDSDVSVTERRTLEQLPEFSSKAIIDGSYGKKLEEYLLDQFPLRDNLRSLKAFWQFDVYKQLDNNDIYRVHDQVCKLDSVLKTEEVTALIRNTNKIYENYLQGMNVFFALIPDKNYFVAEPNGYPALDYAQMEQLLQSGLNNEISYLGMTPFRALTIDDYYRTDIHWMQQSLQPVVDSITTALGTGSADLSTYTSSNHTPFYGSYYGQSALNMKPDVLTTLSNTVTDGCIVTGPELDEEQPVYNQADFQDMDGYNIFLGGPQGIVTVANPNGTTGRELVIFRDSFASSLVPLLMESYDTITLIDLRYLASVNVGKFIEFTNQDILFLYSTTLANSGKLLK